MSEPVTKRAVELVIDLEAPSENMEFDNKSQQYHEPFSPVTGAAVVPFSPVATVPYSPGTVLSIVLPTPMVKLPVEAIIDVASVQDVEEYNNKSAFDGALQRQEPFSPATTTQAPDLKVEVDPTLLFGLERTFLSALSQTFLFMILAMGLSAVSQHDPHPGLVGIVIYVGASLHAISSYAMHWWRLRALERNKPITVANSLVWLGVLTLLGLSVSISEIVFLFVHPVLQRSKPVEVVAQ